MHVNMDVGANISSVCGTLSQPIQMFSAPESRSLWFMFLPEAHSQPILDA